MNISRLIRAIASIFCTFMLAHCGVIKPRTLLSDTSTTLSGKINNVSWTMTSGEARTNVSDPTKIDVILWSNASHSPCTNYSATANNESQIYMTFTPKNGAWTLGSGITAVFSNAGFFYPTSAGYVTLKASAGLLTLTASTPVSLAGKLEVSEGNTNSLTGDFNVQICH
jgi:hypothetical protein